MPATKEKTTKKVASKTTATNTKKANQNSTKKKTNSKKNSSSTKANNTNNTKNSNKNTSSSYSTSTKYAQKTLYRSKNGAFIAGVCKGMADYFELDVTLIRLIAVLLLLFSGGSAILAYIIAWIVMPLKEEAY